MNKINSNKKYNNMVTSDNDKILVVLQPSSCKKLNPTVIYVQIPTYYKSVAYGLMLMHSQLRQLP